MSLIGREVSAHNQIINDSFEASLKETKKAIMSKSTFRILFYVRKNQINKAGKAGIMIRLTINGETSQFSSKLEVDPNLWNVKGQKMEGNSCNARQLNSLLDDIRVSLKNHSHDIEMHETCVTAEKVRNAFLGITIRQQTLLETFRKHNEDVKKEVSVANRTACIIRSWICPIPTQGLHLLECRHDFPFGEFGCPFRRVGGYGGGNFAGCLFPPA